jgi:hypothetical protein
MSSFQEILILTLIIGFVIFLLLREVMTWYWKINEMIELQKENNRLLKIIIEGIAEKEDDISLELIDDEKGNVITKPKKSLREKLKEAEEELKNKKKL